MLVLKLLLSDKYITAWEIALTLPSSLSSSLPPAFCSLYLIEHLSPVPLSLPSLPPSLSSLYLRCVNTAEVSLHPVCGGA